MNASQRVIVETPDFLSPAPIAPDEEIGSRIRASMLRQRL